ncbi:MAG: LapA family protein [Thermodesulfovibrionales bacterium]
MIIIVPLLAIIGLVTIFSVQNSSPVAVSFLFWSFEASLAIVIFLSVLSGILIAVVISFSGKLRHSVKKQIKSGTEEDRGVKN